MSNFGFMTPQQQMQYSMNNQGSPQQVINIINHESNSSNGFKRLPKREVYNNIANYVTCQTRVRVNSLVRLDETVSRLKHSCLRSGVRLLDVNFFSIPGEYGAIRVPFYFCNLCGKLYVYQNFYE